MKKKIMYHGERVEVTRGIYQLFKDKKGKEYNWTAIKGVWFGSIYEAEMKPGGGLTMSRLPDSVEVPGWEPTEKERLEYEAQKLCVRAKRQEKRKAMNLAKPHANVARAVELLRPFYRALGHVDQRRLLEWFANECSKKVGKK